MNATQPTAPKIIKQGKATEIALYQDGAYVVRDYSGYVLDRCSSLEEAISAFDSIEEQEAGSED